MSRKSYYWWYLQDDKLEVHARKTSSVCGASYLPAITKPFWRDGCRAISLGCCSMTGSEARWRLLLPPQVRSCPIIYRQRSSSCVDAILELRDGSGGHWQITVSHYVRARSLYRAEPKTAHGVLSGRPFVAVSDDVEVRRHAPCAAHRGVRVSRHGATGATATVFTTSLARAH